MNQIIFQITIILLFIILIYYFRSRTKSEAIYLRSGLDNKEYLVQNLDNKEEASYILSTIKEKIDQLKEHLKNNINKYPEYESYIKQFIEKSANLILYENPPTGKYTSYTVNKGEEIALCLRSKETGKLHDLNIILYVTIHELAHVACPEVDHTPLFKKIFIFLLGVAIDLKIYKKDNYHENPQEYCGLTINENLLKK